MIMPTLVLAEPLVSCGGIDCDLCQLFVTAKNVINFFTFNIATPLAIIALVAGGFWLLTSGSSEQRRTQGKDAINYALLGLLLVFAAWLIIDLILGNLLSESYKPWNTFPKCDKLPFKSE